ncbi:MAG: LacI family DNA-binding transcriptional regulator [Propionibacteriaceae bacterium]|nr:LacI family DNA-binding transcriptional regulator [Propionibacteriaceae bacterium]
MTGTARGAGRVGIKDVAAVAGVSTTTVSHVLNDVSEARVSSATRARVHEAADRLGYRASRVAKALRTQRSGLIGFLTDHSATTPHAGRMILGAQEVLQEHGMTLVLLSSGGDHRVEQREVEALSATQVDGVLYAPMYHQVVRLPVDLDSFATVLINCRTPHGEPPAIVPDERRAGREATQLLLDAGHRRVGFALNEDPIPATRLRLEGYEDALAAAGVRKDPRLIVTELSESEGGYRAVRQLLDLDDPPTGVFCFNDRMAMGAYRAAAERGLRIPDDVSIVGFDNQPYVAEGLYPALTTMALPHLEMGQWAAERLLRLLAPGGTAESEEPVLQHCPAIPRQSIGPPPAA